MRVQEYIGQQARSAAEEFFRYASAVPDDKVNWSPGEGGRTVMSMCREIGMTPSWAYSAFTDEQREWTPEEFEVQKGEMEQWITVDQCREQFNTRFAKLEQLYLSFSEEDLKKTKWLPYNGGRDHTYLEMMDYPRWNCNYHVGQIGYIQLLYGDKEMH
jgi:hypothetical protein